MAHTPTCYFSIDPMSKGFGYAVLDLPFRLVHFGTARTKGDKRLGAIAAFEKLLDRFRPDALVVEDTKAPGSKRYVRVKKLLHDLIAIARARGLEVFEVARLAVVKCFSSPDAQATKHSISEELVRAFPELQEKLRPKRKAYESERESTAIFDALALAVTHATA